MVSDTETTVLKFCGQLGFTGFLHFKRELYAYAKQRMSPSETLSASLRVARHEQGIHQRIIETEKHSLELTCAASAQENQETFVSALRRLGMEARCVDIAAL